MWAASQSVASIAEGSSHSSGSGPSVSVDHDHTHGDRTGQGTTTDLVDGRQESARARLPQECALDAQGDRHQQP